MNLTSLRILLPALVLAAAIFVIFPGIDLAVAGLFYDGSGFPLREAGWVRFLHAYGEYPATLTGLAGLALWVVARTMRRVRILGLERRSWLFLFLVVFIGSGIVVNLLLKEHIGRARPAQIEEFGGNRTFTPAFMPSDQCERNCSFVSGHAANGFWFVALAFVLSPRLRTAALAFGLTVGFTAGLGRMAQGGHFLSDIIFAGFIMLIVASALHALMFRQTVDPDKGLPQDASGTLREGDDPT